jgi:hypothetical protein
MRCTRAIITVGTHKASSIKVAEAAKVIENTQRDVNIALINELALIFNRLGIDTEEVLSAAGSKWNFLPFRPGLVGGHCIGVDPYYLTHKAQAIGYHPEMILAGRRINDNMGSYVAQQIAQLMILRRIQVRDARVLVLGLTFKENCPDVRNTKIVDVVREIEKYGARWTCTTLGRRRTRPARVRAAAVKKLKRRRLRRRRRGRGPRRVPQDGHRSRCARQARTTCSTTSSTCSGQTKWTAGSEHEDTRHRRRRVHRVSHGDGACWRGRRGRGPGQSQRVLRRPAEVRTPRDPAESQPGFRFVKLDLADRPGMNELFAQEASIA